MTIPRALVAVSIALLAWLAVSVARSDPRVETLADAVIQWAPSTSPERALRLAEIVENVLEYARLTRRRPGASLQIVFAL